MTTEPLLIVGIRASGAVSLTATADVPLPQSPPDLRIKTSGQAQESVISCSGNAWATTLGAGDHIVYLPFSGDSCFDAQAKITFTLGAPATIVSYSDTPALRAWTDEVGTAKDSKNPWPPPLAGNVDITSLPNSTWLSSTLAAMKGEISIDRSAPPYVAPPCPAEPDRSR